VGAGLHALRLPEAGAGVTIQAGLVRGAFSLAIEGRADFPFGARTVEAPRGTVSASVVSAALVPCIEGRFVFGCAVVEGGALQGTGGDVARPRRDTTPLVAAGARFGAQLESDEGWLVRLHGEALAPLTRTTLEIAGAPAWTTPTVSLGVALALGRRF